MATESRRPTITLNASQVVTTSRANGAHASPIESIFARTGRGRTVERRLYEAGNQFNFFQAVRILERLYPPQILVGRGGLPGTEPVGFRVHTSLQFSPNDIVRIHPPSVENKIVVPTLDVTFFGLTGPNGILPRHYTELLLSLERLGQESERFALRSWFDLFNSRFIGLFYWAWEKYRFFVPYERKEYVKLDSDPFTQSLFCMIGLGVPALRNRIHVVKWEGSELGEEKQTELARIDDVALLRYAGLLSHRPRSAIALEALLHDFFRLTVEVQQFQGQWLYIDPDNQTQLAKGNRKSNNLLGVNAVVGERVYNVECKFRLRLGPLSYDEFNDFLPDPEGIKERKLFFLLVDLVRLYAGIEYDVDVQLVLNHDEVPYCKLVDEGDAIGPRLGWNTWAISEPMQHDPDDAIFEACDFATCVDSHRRSTCQVHSSP